MTSHEYLLAMRVPRSKPSATHGLWKFWWQPVTDLVLRCQPDLAGVGEWAILSQWTSSTIHRDVGYTVMEDSPRELRRHLPIVMRASGRVLVTGLGLGCVLRGLLHNPDVEHVDVVEIDSWILSQFGGDFLDNPRVTLHQGDALRYPWRPGDSWDYAWHDVSTEDDVGLTMLHARLMANYRDRVRKGQGAWQFERYLKRRWPLAMLNGSRRDRVRKLP